MPQDITQINNSAILAGQGLPRFNEITPCEIKEKIPVLLEELNKELS